MVPEILVNVYGIIPQACQKVSIISTDCDARIFSKNTQNSKIFKVQENGYN